MVKHLRPTEMLTFNKNLKDQWYILEHVYSSKINGKVNYLASKIISDKFSSLLKNLVESTMAQCDIYDPFTEIWVCD